MAFIPTADLIAHPNLNYVWDTSTLTWVPQTQSSGGTGTVTSVGLSLPALLFSVTGSPVTTAGTLTGSLITQVANTVFAGPTSGGAATPTFRALVAADLPTITEASISFTDITTNDVSTTKHGFAPKAPNDVTKFLNGAGAYTVPAGSSAPDTDQNILAVEIFT